jgi:HD-like signal output (HDOD) protein
MAIDPSLLLDLSGDECNSVKRLFEKGVIIPPQPRVLQNLQDALARGVADVRELSRIISQDPAIVATLFKVVQSAAYRHGQPYLSLPDILQAIGLQQTCNLVRAISLASAVPSKHNRRAFEAYWMRSQAIADLAMLVAEERVTVCNIFPDQACLAGIFHDCGVPVLMQRFTTYCKDMHLDEPGCWADLGEEDARFNVDHCVIGYLVGKHWRLPDFICDAIRFHHDITRLDNHESRTMVAILQLAIHIYSMDQRMGNPEWARSSKDVLDELGLSEDSLPELLDIVLERYHKAT